MIFGMSAFTFVHVVISLIAILAGLVVVIGMLEAKRLEGWTMLFLVMTMATSVTGFRFPRDHLLPSHVVAIISLVLLALAIAGLYVFRLAGAWRWIYVIGAVVSLYLNVFVLIVQLFQKVPALHALAPKGSEPPFAIVQGAALILFVILTVLCVRRFRPAGAG